MAASMMVSAKHRFESCVRGYHVYESVWTPVMGELLHCAPETGNRHDPYAVRVLKSGITM